jgi:hypothetical protein
MKAEVERIRQFAVALAAIAATPLLRLRVVVAAGRALVYVIGVRWDPSF